MPAASRSASKSRRPRPRLEDDREFLLLRVPASNNGSRRLCRKLLARCQGEQAPWVPRGSIPGIRERRARRTHQGFHRCVHGQRGARELLLPRLTNDAIAPDFESQISERKPPWGSARRSHCVRHEDRSRDSFRAGKCAEHLGGKMHAIGDEAHGEPIVGKLRVDGIVVSMEHLGATISQVCREECSCIRRRGDLRSRCQGMADGGKHALRAELPDEWNRAANFRGERDQPDQSARGALQPPPQRPIEWKHVSSGVRATGAVVRADPGPLQVESWDRTGDLRIESASGDEIPQQRFQPFWVGRDNRRQHLRDAGARKGGKSGGQPVRSGFRMIEVNTCEAVALQIEKTRTAD